jgi:hypothetical protein
MCLEGWPDGGSQTLVGETKPEVPIEESWKSRMKIQFSAQGEFRFAMESSEDSVYDTSALMDILLSLPGSAMTTLGLAWLNHNICVDVEASQPASQQASLPVRKRL